MTIKIDRRWKKPGYTIGKVYVDGLWFGCESLEDTDRGLTDKMTEKEIGAIKRYGETAIPTGKYVLTYTMSPKFGKKLPLVNNVKGFSGIRIHAGNTPKDTYGCILLGRNTKVGMVTDSRHWTDKLICLMREAWNRNEDVFLVIE